MALTKVNRGGLNTGIADSSNATFLSVDASEVATLLTTAVINSEGGAVTTNIAQGLTKAWADFDSTGTLAIRDSLNVSGITDGGTGTFTITINNDMANTSYVAKAQGGDHVGNADTYAVPSCHDLIVGAFQIALFRPSNSAAADNSYVGITVDGDLA